MRPVDLRSDTVTRPTPEMRRAMAEAEVGDDVWGDDPTVIALEAETAARAGQGGGGVRPVGDDGKPDRRSAPRRGPGDEILVHRMAHVVVHEQGGVAALSGVQPALLDGDRRHARRRDARARAWHDASDVHYARQSLVCVENTVGEAGGLVVAPERIRDIAAFAREHGMRVHMDGARLWNAAVALGLPPADGRAPTSTPSRCASRRASARRSARRWRATPTLIAAGAPKPQAASAAACARRASSPPAPCTRFATTSSGSPTTTETRAGSPRASPASRRIRVDPAAVETNIVLAAVPDGSAEALVDELAGAGVLAGWLDAHTVRFVTHLDAQDDAVDRGPGRHGADATLNA